MERCYVKKEKWVAKKESGKKRNLSKREIFWTQYKEKTNKKTLYSSFRFAEGKVCNRSKIISLASFIISK